MGVFTKLFTIKYNNKQFLILYDENHRKTFLEISPEGKYLYPLYEDFKELNEIFNNRDYTILADKKQFTYNERAIIGGAIVAINVALGGLAAKGAVTIVEKGYNERSIRVTFDSLYKENYNDREKLNLVYGDEVITRDDVVDAINNNHKLNDKYKEMAIMVLDGNLALDPEADLRIYYENMKDLEIKTCTYEKLEKVAGAPANGCFSSSQDTIWIGEDDADNVLIHELVHAFHTIFDVEGDKVVHIFTTFGDSLEEGMTENISEILGKTNCTYANNRRILQYLTDNVDEFNYHIYNEKGIMGLVNELKEKYPTVDIDYIVEYIDTWNRASNVSLGVDSLLADEDFFNELFKIAINNIDKDDPYLAYDTFIKTFPTVDENFRAKYMALYYQQLVSQKLIDSDFAKYAQKINSMCIINDNLYFSYDGNYINYDGEIIPFSEDDKPLMIPLYNFDEGRLLSEVCTRAGGKIYSREVISSLLHDEQFIKKINLFNASYEDSIKYMDGLFQFLKDDIKADDLFREWSIIARIINYEYAINYVDTYDAYLVEKGLVNPSVVDGVRKCSGIVLADGKMQFYEKIDNKGFSFRIPFLGGYSSAFNSSNVFFLEPQVNAQCYDTDGNLVDVTFKNKLYKQLWLSNEGENEIIQYATDNKVTNVFSPEFLGDVTANFEYFDQEKYNKFADGTVAFDEITDSMQLVLGLNEDNKLGIMLYDGDKLIYGTCDKFTSPTASIPYNLYINMFDKPNFESIEEIVSEAAVGRADSSLLAYLAPNMHKDKQWNEAGNANDEHYDYKYSFEELHKLYIDGVEYPLKSVIISTDIDDNILLYIPGMGETNIGSASNNDYLLSFVEKEMYYQTLDVCLDALNIKPDENGAYNLTKDEVINIFNNYIETLHTGEYSK